MFYLTGWFREMLRTMRQTLTCILRRYNRAGTWGESVEPKESLSERDYEVDNVPLGSTLTS